MKSRAVFRVPRIKRPRECGFTLVAVVFLITALATLAAFVANISTSQHMTTLLSVQNARAYNAAKSGLEWAIRSATVSNSCGNSNFVLNPPGLSGYSVSVSCSRTAVTEGTTNYVVYLLGSTATAGGAATGDLTSRTIDATVTTATGP
ncbi:MAG: hypothetical protein HYX63_21515 [Gammaproteobacteria bacterium]|nr:hypothetical protein [Gammaproteobacteria bacterium]